MNLFKHFLTITRHRHLVIKYCFKCGLYKQGLLHDLSKYSPTEFFSGVKNYAGIYSPHFNERKKKGYSEAWLHHKGRNKHHSEYWYDYNNDSKSYECVPMPDRYIAESFCDRLAASKNYNRKKYTTNIPYDYFMKTKDSILMHEESQKKMEELLVMYMEYGEKYTFRYIKHNLVKKRAKKDV